MTKDELVAGLLDIVERQKSPMCDEEMEHGEADSLLLNFIADDEVTNAYNAIHKWYA